MLIAAALLALLALFAASAAIAQEGGREDESDAKAIDDPMNVFRGVELAWQKGNAQQIADLGSASQIYIELKGIDRRGAYFTKPQVAYLFKKMFESTSELTFQFTKFRNMENPDRRVYGVAHRQYKNVRRGGIFEDTVYVTLVKEEARWVVAEIKSTW